MPPVDLRSYVSGLFSGSGVDEPNVETCVPEQVCYTVPLGKMRQHILTRGDAMR